VVCAVVVALVTIRPSPDADGDALENAGTNGESYEAGGAPARHANKPAISMPDLPDPLPAVLPVPFTAGVQVVYSPRAARQSRYTTIKELTERLGQITSIADHRKRMLDLVELGKQLCDEDYDNALKLVAKVNDVRAARALYEGIFFARAVEDPQEAMATALSMDKGGAGGSLDRASRMRRMYVLSSLRGLMTGWGQSDAVEALQQIEDLPRKYQVPARQAVYRGWADSDPDAALEAALTLPAAVQSYLLPEVFGGWAGRDPVAAVECAQSLTDIESRVQNRVWQKIAGSFILHWKVEDFESTADWAAASFPPSMHNHVLPSIYREWASRDPVGAARHAAGLDGELVVNRSVIIGSILAKWAEQDVESALAWAAETIEDDRSYLAALLTTARSLCHRHPEKAVAILNAQPELYANGRGLVRSLAYGLVRQDPAAAADWAVGLENGGNRADAVKNVAGQWAVKQYDQAFKWGDELTDDKLRAYALSNIALKQGQNSVKKSVEWIKDLQPGFPRDRSVAAYVYARIRNDRDWRSARKIKTQIRDDRIDMAAVHRIVETARVSPEVKQEMLDWFK